MSGVINVAMKCAELFTFIVMIATYVKIVFAKSAKNVIVIASVNPKHPNVHIQPAVLTAAKDVQSATRIPTLPHLL